MFKLLLISLILFSVQTANISITSPQPGDILRGQVEIVGNMDIPDFASAELAFSYAIPVGDASNTADRFAWFTIQTFPQPVHAERPTLAVWDTTTLTDGDYVLHLRVFLQDGSTQDAVVSDLKIRNDTPLADDAPTPTESSDSITINPLPISSPARAVTVQPATALPTFPSPTPLPANPASVTSTSIYSNFARGGLITLVLFAFFSLILRLRKN
jgi:hypothetical protein